MSSQESKQVESVEVRLPVHLVRILDFLDVFVDQDRDELFELAVRHIVRELRPSALETLEEMRELIESFSD